MAGSTSVHSTLSNIYSELNNAAGLRVSEIYHTLDMIANCIALSSIVKPLRKYSVAV